MKAVYRRALRRFHALRLLRPWYQGTWAADFAAMLGLAISTPRYAV